MQTKIIAIGHKSKQGKDTLGRTIIFDCFKHNLYARQYGFATALKAYCRILGMRSKDGHLLQTVGTDVFRRIDPDTWVRILFDTIDEDKPDVAVITDLRFLNELTAVKRASGVTINVIRFQPSGEQYRTDDRDPNHYSETALDHVAFDHTIESRSLVDFGKQCEKLIDKLRLNWS